MFKRFSDFTLWTISVMITKNELRVATLSTSISGGS